MIREEQKEGKTGIGKNYKASEQCLGTWSKEG